jgi:GTP-binding protein
MKIRSAALAVTAAGAKDFPADGLPQIALAGRSNAGKSSLINALTGSKSLARSSQTPGKTRLINFYRVDGSFYFADLPGFGYARVDFDARRLMESVLQAYFGATRGLRGVLYLVDARVPDSSVDQAALGWILAQGSPLLVLAAKCDKLPKSQWEKALKRITEFHGLPDPPLPISSVKKTGLPALWEQIGILLGRGSGALDPARTLQ